MEANVNRAMSCRQCQPIAGYLGNTGIESWSDKMSSYRAGPEAGNVRGTLDFGLAKATLIREEFLQFTFWPSSMQPSRAFVFKAHGHAAAQFQHQGAHMTMRNARLIVVLIGIVLPYAARLPRGTEWLEQYTDIGLGGWLLFAAFNAIAWGAILALSFMYRRPASLIAPCLLGFGYLAWAHSTLDLGADAQSAIALVFIPIYALVLIAVGGAVGYIVDRKLRRYGAA